MHTYGLEVGVDCVKPRKLHKNESLMLTTK